MNEWKKVRSDTWNVVRNGQPLAEVHLRDNGEWVGSIDGGERMTPYPDAESAKAAVERQMRRDGIW